MRQPTRAYCLLTATVLGVQGVSTLAALAFPAVDRALPFLLALTRMVPLHSTLHVASAATALLALAIGRSRAFAIVFGLAYTALAVAGWWSQSGLCLSLQPFDHPFHLVLGLLGILAVAVERTGMKGEP